MKFLSIFTLSLLLANTSIHSADIYHEKLFDGWAQEITIDEVIYQDKTPLQDLIIFKNKFFGRVLGLDGVVQVTENDEFIYHEMIAHIPLLSHKNPKNVLIIGGGDGGVLREVLRHKNIEKITVVEIDPDVIAFSKEHLKFISQGSLDNPRATIIIADGCEFVKNTDERFDVIICDSTDPIGPGLVLFTHEFYQDCYNILQEGGIFVNQNGVPFIQDTCYKETFLSRQSIFTTTSYFLVPIPTYIGGMMAFGYSTKGDVAFPTKDFLTSRATQVEGTLRYYSPAVHLGSFAIPPYLEVRATND